MGRTVSSPAIVRGSVRDLFSAKRVGQDVPAADDRSAFEIDYDRIAFCDAFRALARKTQVHGETGNDYVRSRLTHSLEVSRVGRFLGTLIGRALMPRGLVPESVGPAGIGHILAAACLMHDIGNPPFGHSGERIISEFFRDDPFGARLIVDCSPRFRTEITHYEGNAQGFRVVTRTQGWRSEGGLMLTSATLAAFAKYPFAADPAIGTTDTKHKYGFYESDAEAFRQVAHDTGMIPGDRALAWRRHPLAYFVEAADDTCYRVVDLEDAADLGVISFAEAEELLWPLGEASLGEYRALENDRRKLVYLRGKAIERLIHAVADLIPEVEASLLDGTHPGDLLLQTRFGPHLRTVERFSRTYIYANAKRKAYEADAARTLKGVLRVLSEALLERERAGGPVRHPALALIPNAHLLPYAREGWLRALLDWIGAMTDASAIETARKLDADFTARTP